MDMRKLSALLLAVFLAACSAPSDRYASPPDEVSSGVSELSAAATPSEPEEPEEVILTTENAEGFITEALSTLTVFEDGRAAFTLPEVIPVDPEGKTELVVSMNSTYVVDVATYRVESYLDWATGWKGGETHTVIVEPETEQDGELLDIMLRVAFMTEVNEKQYKEYAADHVRLSAPFDYGGPTEVLEASARPLPNGDSLTVEYTTRDGRGFWVALALPEGTEAANIKETADLPEVELFRKGEKIGTIVQMAFGAPDDATLETVDPSAKELPMQIYSPLALSNMFDYSSAYRVVSYSDTGSAAVTKVIKGGHDASGEVVNDCVLAFDLDGEHYFTAVLFSPDVLTAEELSAIAESIAISPKA